MCRNIFHFWKISAWQLWLALQLYCNSISSFLSVPYALFMEKLNSHIPFKMLLSFTGALTLSSCWSLIPLHLSTWIYSFYIFKQYILMFSLYSPWIHNNKVSEIRDCIFCSLHNFFTTSQLHLFAHLETKDFEPCLS